MLIPIFFFLIFIFFFLKNYQIPVLMYHHINSEKFFDKDGIDKEIFHKQMFFLKRHNYRVINLETYLYLKSKKFFFPYKYVLITFDDGYKDNLEAIKILKDFDFPAIIFLSYNLIGKKNYLDFEEIKWVLKNTKVEIGAHGLNHFYLPEREDFSQEIILSKKNLEIAFEKKIEAFAYPLGGFNERILSVIKKNFSCAFTTNRSFKDRNKDNLFTLRRIKITGCDLGLRFWAKLSGLYDFFKKPKSPY